jgi:UDP-N-acetyl-D-glucosamine dehydrogenase
VHEELLARLRARSAHVAVLGQGYVGLVVAMRACEAGFQVTGLETDTARAEQLRAGRSYIEDEPDEVILAALERGYRPTSDPGDLSGFDVAVISVPTPLREGVPDLSYIESAGRHAAASLTPGALVILESTTYPGTTEELLRPILEEGSGLTAGRDFLLGYSPERIDPGNATHRLHNTPKVVGGIDQASTAAMAAFFGAFVEEVVQVPDCGTAELTKIIENTFRHVNIALVNEIAMFAHALGIDVNAAIDAAETKPFGYLPFRPGPGVGGHCLPVDPSYLAWRVKRSLGDNFRFVELANDINDHMPRYVVQRIVTALNRDRKAVNGAHIVALGVSYKRNVGDTRETPTTAVIQQLRELGAEVTTVDPHVPGDTFAGARHRTSYDTALLRSCDLALVLTDHDAFDYDEVAATAQRVLDTRDRIRSEAPHLERL